MKLPEKEINNYVVTYIFFLNYYFISVHLEWQPAIW